MGFSSLTRDQTWAPGLGSLESQVTGQPREVHLWLIFIWLFISSPTPCPLFTIICKSIALEDLNCYLPLTCTKDPVICCRKIIQVDVSLNPGPCIYLGLTQAPICFLSPWVALARFDCPRLKSGDILDSPQSHSGSPIDIKRYKSSTFWMCLSPTHLIITAHMPATSLPPVLYLSSSFDRRQSP